MTSLSKVVLFKVIHVWEDGSATKRQNIPGRELYALFHFTNIKALIYTCIYIYIYIHLWSMFAP